MNSEDIKKYREILSEAWATELDKKRGLVRHGPEPVKAPEPSIPDYKTMTKWIEEFRDAMRANNRKDGEAVGTNHLVDKICFLAQEALDARQKKAGGVFGASPPVK